MSRIAYTFATAVEAVGIKEQCLASAIKSGDLKAYRVGGSMVILGTDIQAWVELQPDWRYHSTSD